MIRVHLAPSLVAIHIHVFCHYLRISAIARHFWREPYAHSAQAFYISFGDACWCPIAPCWQPRRTDASVIHDPSLKVQQELCTIMPPSPSLCMSTEGPQHPGRSKAVLIVWDNAISMSMDPQLGAAVCGYRLKLNKPFGVAMTSPCSPIFFLCDIGETVF